MMEKYNFDPSKVKIRKHVGTLYQLKWTKLVKSGNKDTDHGCIQDYLQNRKLADSDDLIKISIIPSKKFDHYINDHYSQYYRHAIQDPLCKDLNLSIEEKNSEIIKFSNTQNLPDWIPNITDGDDYFTCSRNKASNPQSFIWRNYESEISCDGKATDCDINQITRIICINSTHYCQWPKSGQECLNYKPLDGGSPENRCMEREEDKVINVSSSYHHTLISIVHQEVVIEMGIHLLEVLIMGEVRVKYRMKIIVMILNHVQCH